MEEKKHVLDSVSDNYFLEVQPTRDGFEVEVNAYFVDTDMPFSVEDTRRIDHAFVDSVIPLRLNRQGVNDLILKLGDVKASLDRKNGACNG